MKDKTHLESEGVVKMCLTARTHRPAMFNWSSHALVCTYRGQLNLREEAKCGRDAPSNQ